MVDSLQKIEEEVIDELELNKARMTLVDKDRSNVLLDSMTSPIRAAGGSAANTAYWAAQLGGNVGFIGKISEDELGEQFKASVKDSGLKDFTVFESEDNQTGHCAIFITPDGERTMNTSDNVIAFFPPVDLFRFAACKKASLLVGLSQRYPSIYRISADSIAFSSKSSTVRNAPAPKYVFIVRSPSGVIKIAQ